jgi:DNA processing protein
MAHGIDTAAHIGGLKGCGSSIAVVGTGLDKVYPAKNRDLAHELAEKGTLVSEFPLGTPPLAHNFPRRNRIISGLSKGCLVVEASLQSGSLITARMALEQGREIFAIPGSIHMPQAKGCHALIKQGAKLVENPNDILNELDWLKPNGSSSAQQREEHPLFAHLGFDPIDLDSLSLRSNLTIEDLSAILLQLELDGLVTTLSGGLYQRIV